MSESALRSAFVQPVFTSPAPLRTSARCSSDAPRPAKTTRRAALQGLCAAALLPFLPVHAEQRALGTALIGLVRVRDGIAELEAGSGGGDVLRIVKLLLRGSDVRGDAADAARWLDDDTAAARVTDGARDAREMLDLAVAYYDPRGRPSVEQLRFAAQALAAAREALDEALKPFGESEVSAAREALSAPAF